MSKSVKDLTKEKLKYHYQEERLSYEEIADLYNCGSSSVGYKMRKWDINRRDYSESKVNDWERGKYDSEETRQRMGFYENHSKETKKKISESNSGSNNYWHGKELSKQHRQNIRESKIELLKSGDIAPNYNKFACEVFDAISDELGWDIQHAENGGERFVSCGFWLDGWCEKRSLAFEFDEQHHFSGGKLREKDLERERKIKSELNCDFIRIKEPAKIYRGPQKVTETVRNALRRSRPKK